MCARCQAGNKRVKTWAAFVALALAVAALLRGGGGHAKPSLLFRGFCIITCYGLVPVVCSVLEQGSDLA